MAVDRWRIFGESGNDLERIAPGFFSAYVVDDHVSRYNWASRHVRGARVAVDIAAGTGYGAVILRRWGARSVVSFDISFDALTFGRDRYGLFPVCCDAERLPLRSGTVEAVVSLETIEHLPHADMFVAEAARVLVPNGLLAVTTPNAERSERANPYHLAEYTLTELLAMLSASGFRPTGVWGQHWALGARIFRGWGFRRIAWEMERRNAVWRPPVPGVSPRFWCVVARRKSAQR